MSNAVVFERRNKQIQDALDSGNLKQALQHCEKRLKKGERSHFLQAWKANILLAHPDNAHKQRGYQETLELCRADPPVTDLDALDLLYESLRDGDEYKEASQLVWERAAKAKPHDLDIHLRWFTNAMDAGDWKTAQKAAMSLQVNFKERKFYFWAVFLCYMIAVDPASSDLDRKLFGTLAYRMVSKAASLVPSDPQEVAPPRAVKNSEELLLLVKIFETQGRYVEIAETLGSKSTGIESKIAQGDWTFVQERIASLRKAHLWEELLRTTKELLALPEGEDEKPAFDPEERDDWKVWQGLLEATKEQWEQANDDSLSFVDAYIEKRPKSRNAQLCRLELVVAGVKKGRFSSDDLLQQCQKFFDTNCRKLPCFSDLRDIIPNLGSSDIKEFIGHASKPIESDLKSDGIDAINALKFKYCFDLKFDDTGNSAVKAVNAFAATCLRIYRSLGGKQEGGKGDTIESQPRDDLCIMAAMALIKLHEQDFATRPYPLPRPAHIQAAAILHHMLLQSPHNYEALLLISRIYMLLGTGSLALQTFAKLNVKQMQYDSVAHNIFSRLSTIHPQPAPREEGFETKDTDPQWAYRVALDFYRRSGRATTIAKVKGLETGAYVNIQGSINLQDQLDRSICQRMYALEERRVERLLGEAPNGRYDHIVFDKSPVVDRRNFEGFMNLEAPNLPTFEEHVRVGPLIGEHGLRAMTLTDTLFYLLRNPKPTPGKTSQPDVFQFAGFDKEVREEELTYAELDNVKIQLGLLKGVNGLASGQSGATDVQAAVDQVAGWVAGKAQQLSDETYLDTKSIGMSDSLLLPCWTYLHSNICRLETLNAITLFIQGVAKSKAAKVPKDALDALRSKVSQLLEIIRTNTKTLKRHLTSSGVLGAITAACIDGDDELRGELEQHLDEASLELFAGSLIESWEEALDGVATCGMF